MKNDRVILHTVAHEGGMAIYWGGGNDDHSRPMGSAEIERNGAFVMRFNRESDDEPFCLVIGGPHGQVVIYATEDAVSDMGAEVQQVFNSSN